MLLYAQGGGLGHLNRARAFLETQNRLATDWYLMTASPWADFVFPEYAEHIILVPQQFSQDIPQYRLWLKEQIRLLSIREIVLDTFPCGLLGEWNQAADFPEQALSYFYLGRALKWDRYRHLLHKPPYFQISYRLETLGLEQESFLGTYSSQVVDLSLALPKAQLPEHIKSQLQALRASAEELWLVVHSGPADEMYTLVQYARDCVRMEKKSPQFLLLSPYENALLDLGKMLHRHYYPAHLLFPWASCVWTGGGFNSMWEASQYPIQHRAYPFARRYDDQFARVARYREKSNL